RCTADTVSSASTMTREIVRLGDTLAECTAVETVDAHPKVVAPIPSIAKRAISCMVLAPPRGCPPFRTKKVNSRARTADGHRVLTVTERKEISPSPADRRRFPRYRYVIPVTLQLSDGTSHPAISIEISESGMSICTAAALTVGAQIELERFFGARAAAA